MRRARPAGAAARPAEATEGGGRRSRRSGRRGGRSRRKRRSYGGRVGAAGQRWHRGARRGGKTAGAGAACEQQVRCLGQRKPDAESTRRGEARRGGGAGPVKGTASEALAGGRSHGGRGNGIAVPAFHFPSLLPPALPSFLPSFLHSFRFPPVTASDIHIRTDLWPGLAGWILVCGHVGNGNGSTRQRSASHSHNHNHRRFHWQAQEHLDAPKEPQPV